MNRLEFGAWSFVHLSTFTLVKIGLRFLQESYLFIALAQVFDWLKFYIPKHLKWFTLIQESFEYSKLEINNHNCIRLTSQMQMQIETEGNVWWSAYHFLCTLVINPKRPHIHTSTWNGKPFNEKTFSKQFSNTFWMLNAFQKREKKKFNINSYAYLRIQVFKLFATTQLIWRACFVNVHKTNNSNYQQRHTQKRKPYADKCPSSCISFNLEQLLIFNDYFSYWTFVCVCFLFLVLFHKYTMCSCVCSI